MLALLCVSDIYLSCFKSVNSSTKCELAKVLNQQTFFHDVLEKKDAIINELDQTLDQLGVADVKRQMLYG